MTAIPARLRARWDGLVQLAERRLPALTRYKRPEALPITLHQRRIYVIPTRFGLGFGTMLAVMLLGALNFNNNPALLLTFLLAGGALLAMPRTVQHLNGIRLVAARGQTVHAGQILTVQLHFQQTENQARPRLSLHRDDTIERFDLVEGGTVTPMRVTATRRGLQAVGRLALSAEYPFGMFHAWSVLNPDETVLVYARPESPAPPLPRKAARDAHHERAAQGEDWHGLRDYRVGDPQRAIAWKASARQDRLLSKEFAEPAGDEVVLDWHALHGLDHEHRIARLTAWVLDAAAQNLSFRLILPQAALGPARGDEHKHACLRELALLP